MKERRTNRRKKNKAIINERKCLRAFIKECIDKTAPADGQRHSNNNPVKIEGEGAINETMIKEHMQTCTNEVLVDRDNAEEYLKETGQDISAITDDMVTDSGQIMCSVYRSSLQYSGVRSAIAYLYKLARVLMPIEMQKELSTFFIMNEPYNPNSKRKLGLKMSHGRKRLCLKAYELLAKKLFISRKPEDVFAHLFLTLDWSLIKRAENCVSAKFFYLNLQNLKVIRKEKNM